MTTIEQHPSEHTRINDTLLGPWERAFIRWYMEKAPAWVTPDILTWVGVFGSILVAAGYILSTQSPHFLWLSCLGIILNWFGDSTDGNLARYRHIERPKYGFFLDHSVDTISMALIFVSLGLSDYVRFDIALLGLVGYLMLSVFVYLDTFVNSTFKISFAKLGPTEARGIVIIVNTLIFLFGRPEVTLPFGTFTVYDLIAAAVAVLLVIFYFVMIVTRLMELAKLEPPNVRRDV
jgi:phosphatidylglycerophosphate synthase